MNGLRDTDTDELLRFASTGDDQAGERLLERHRDRLRRLVAVRLDSRLATRVDASDVVQDTLTTAHRGLAEYLHNKPIAFYPWLRQIALNRLTDLYRFHVRAGKRSLDREVPISPGVNDESAMQLAQQLVDSCSSPSRQLLHAELKLRVMAALDQLPNVEREIMVMRHLERLPIKEIAVILEMPTGSVMSRHYRAVRTLRRLLDE